jgi:hypothetical protein
MGVPFEETIERMRQSGGLKNASAIARVVEVTPQALSNYKKRGLMPADLVLKFAKIHSISMDWLVTGHGEMPKIGTECSEEEQSFEVLKVFDALSLSPDELIYTGKLLKLLRCSSLDSGQVIKNLINKYYSNLDEPSKESTERSYL